MKKILALLLTLGLSLFAVQAIAETEVVVFAAASLTESLNAIAELYEKNAPEIKLTFNFDSSGTLKTQLAQGASADVFISAGQKQMNELDLSADASVNKERLDRVLQGSRIDLLTNVIVLVTPKDSSASIASFDDVATERVSLMALGNSDVPVGQYAAEIFTKLGLLDALLSEGKITFASNVKEVLAQVEIAAVDCGVVYLSDALTSSEVAVAAAAPEGSHQPVHYPAAVLKDSAHPEEAKTFLEFLQTEACQAVFIDMGFGIPGR